MEEIEKIRNKIRKEAEKNIEIDDSDIPIHEKFVREEQTKELKRDKKRYV